jgi:hypothetical protein
MAVKTILSLKLSSKATRATEHPKQLQQTKRMPNRLKPENTLKAQPFANLKINTLTPKV